MFFDTKPNGKLSSKSSRINEADHDIHTRKGRSKLHQQMNRIGSGHRPQRLIWLTSRTAPRAADVVMAA